MGFRTSILEFESTQRVQSSHEAKLCTSVAQLEQYLDRPREGTGASTGRRIFVIETPLCQYDELDPAFCYLRALLRAKMGVPEDIFDLHRWSRTTFQFNEIINCPRLPTAMNPRKWFSLELFEMWHTEGQDASVLDHHNPATVTCEATGREIQCYKWKESPMTGWLLVAPRKCSFWSKENTYGWDAIILCDPAPKKVTVNGLSITLNIKSFERGYHHFIPDAFLGSKSENPPQTSIFDDMVYYFKTHSNILVDLEDPFSAAIFPQKIVASHYCPLLGFVSHQTASMRSSGWAVQRRTQTEVKQSDQVETTWSQFKCPEYLEALGAILDSLGVVQGREPYETFDVMAHASEIEVRVSAGLQQQTQTARPDHNTDWRSSTADFLYLHREFRLHLADYARMTSSLAALNGMIGGRIAILEARTAKSLTLVAMLFAPPACVASIFSIPSDIFGQNGPPFWWYWAAAVPLTVVVFIITYLVHERDDLRRGWRARRRARTHDVSDDDASTKV